MMSTINKLLSTITKRHFWYNIRFSYVDKKGFIRQTWTYQVGLISKNESLQHRKLKKMFQPLHKSLNTKDSVHRINGTINVEIICYLGWFKKQN